MGFSRQQYWSGLLFPSPGDLPDPGIELGSPALQADTLPSESPGNHQSPNRRLSFSHILAFVIKCVIHSAVSDPFQPHGL